MWGSSFISPVTIPQKVATRAAPNRQLCPRCSQSEDNETPPQISTNWREFRAAMVAGSKEKHENEKANAHRIGHWAHPLSLPEAGCFLASHPAYYRRKTPYLTQSVIFLTHYDPATGATGLILNRPMQGTASELEQSGLFGRSLNISTTEFSDQPVYIGGPNTPEKGILSVVHSDMKVGGVQPIDGVFVCDVNQYLSLNPSKDASEARLLFGSVKWPRGALESEVDDGSFYCVSASKFFALRHCIQLPVPLWKEIMICQGGIFEEIGKKHG